MVESKELSAGEEPVNPRSTGREYYEAILIAVVFALFVRTFVVQAFKIPSGSMMKNLLVGDHILVNKLVYGPRQGRFWDRIVPYRDVSRGDVVVFKWPRDLDRDFIKRCIAIPGDVIEIRHKVVYINGEVRKEVPPVFFLAEDSETEAPADDPDRPVRDNLSAFTVPADSYFMMGDNRNNSYDSRYWGVVPKDYVKGNALLAYWSFETPKEWEGAGAESLSGKETLRRLGYVAVHFFTKTRWARSFQTIR